MRNVKALVMASLLASPLSSQLSYANEGMDLMADANCMSCHASQPTAGPKGIAFESPFNAAASKVETKSDVAKWVRLCDAQLQTGWFPDEVEAVAKYLNDEYYKLK